MTKRTNPDKPDKPLTDKEWKSLGTAMHGVDGLPVAARKAVKAVMGRPRKEVTKQPISFRLDADIVSHLKDDVKGYNRRVESLLRDAITEGRI